MLQMRMMYMSLLQRRVGKEEVEMEWGDGDDIEVEIKVESLQGDGVKPD